MKRVMIVAMVTGLLLLSACARQEQSPAGAKKFERVPPEPDVMISVWYNGGKGRAPMLSPLTPNSRDEWRRDLQQIRSLGFNTVRGWVDWSHNEPQEGRYNFDNLRMLCDLAKEEGLRVFIQIYAGWDGFGFAPDWVHKKYPEAFVDEQQIQLVSTPPSNSFYSDHKEIQDAIIRFLKETAKIAVEYPNFYGWDLWSEPRAMRLVGPGTRIRYREWLRNRYKTIEALNREWYETYASWDDVHPLRTGGIGTYAMDLDWNEFIAEKGAEDMARQYAAIREIDRTHVITSHASPPSIFGRGLDDFLEAESLDYYGLSVYPRYVGEPRLWRMLLGADFSRSANRKNRGFYVGEFQGGFSTNGMSIGDPVTPDDHRTWMWSLLAKGARSINIYAYYVMSSGVESGGFGMIGLDGKVTERARELGVIAQTVERNKGLLVKSRPVEAEVALIYNPSAQSVGGARGAPASGPSRESPGAFYQDSLAGYWQTFAENNVPVDFVHRNELETGDLSRYKLVIFPCPILMTPQAAEGLKKYIAQGGSAVSEARLAWNSEHAYSADVIPGMGLSEVFGIRETKVSSRPEANMLVAETAHPVLAGLKKGDVLKGAQFVESVEVLPNSGARVLATWEDGTAAAAASTYQKGQTLFVGSFLGLANQIAPGKNSRQLLLGLLDWAKVSRPLKTSQDGMDTETPFEARLHENAEGYVLFMINHAGAAKPVTADLDVKAAGEFELNEITHGKSLQKRSEGNRLTISSEIPAKQVEVWEIKRKSAGSAEL